MGFVAVVAAPLVGWLTILLWRSPDSCGFGFRARHHMSQCTGNPPLLVSCGSMLILVEITGVYEDTDDTAGVVGSQPRYVSAGLSTTLPPFLHRVLMVGGLIGAVIWIDMVSGQCRSKPDVACGFRDCCVIKRGCL